MAKNQIHALIDMLRDTMVAHNVHDAIAAAALLSLPVLVVLWITNRMRHPERSFPGTRCAGALTAAWPPTAEARLLLRGL